MSRIVRRVVIATVLMLVAVACGGTKDTGLEKGPTPDQTVAKGVVQARDSSFDPKEIRVKVGEEVTWQFVSSLPHNAVADDGSFNTHDGCVAAVQTKCSKPGDSNKVKFTKAGEVPYYCAIHGFKGGIGMAGTVIVQA